MAKRLIVGVVGTVLTILMYAGCGRAIDHNLDQINRPLEIQEDDPRWNCKTMGNRICGKVDE